LFSRDPVVSQPLRDALVARTRALGYDVRRLEFPLQG
jgi:lipocalin